MRVLQLLELKPLCYISFTEGFKLKKYLKDADRTDRCWDLNWMNDEWNETMDSLSDDEDDDDDDSSRKTHVGMTFEINERG